MLGTTILATCCLCIALGAQGVPPVPNAEFTEGTDAPAGWRLSGGQGRWVDRQILEVTGNGRDANHWQCDYRFQPGTLYRFEFRGRATAGSGCVVSGPSFANHDWRLGPEWKWYGYVFRTPESAGSDVLRLGQWQAKGTFQFDAVRLSRVIPVYRSSGGMILGEGETIREGRYAFTGTFGHEGTNFHRVLHSATAAFNTDRWCFGTGSQVTYRFQLPGQEFRSGRISFNVNYHTRGGCLAEVSRDENTWRPLVTQEKLGTAEAELPAEVLPAKTLFLRLKSAPENSSFQVNRVEFTAELSGTPAEAVGQTEFAEIAQASPTLRVDQLLLEDSSQPGQIALMLIAHKTDSSEIAATISGTIGSAGGQEVPLSPQSAQLDAGRPAGFRLEVPAGKPGRNELTLRLSAPGHEPTVLKAAIKVPDFHRADYGRLIEAGPGPAVVWWCDATHKIAQQRPAPEETSPAAELSAARSDWEAVQVVVRPTAPLKGLTVTASPLRGPAGATIPAANTRISRVGYHFVHHPTDATGLRDWWPDALPPLKGPIDLPAGKNQPLWVLLYVPKDVAAGDYSGEISLRAEGWSARVPIKLHVWDFALPERNHLETALGLSPETIFRYHGLKSEADKRRVLDLYLQSFAEHRISPYDPAPLDRIGVKFLGEADPPRAELDFSRFDPAMTRALEKFRFSNFMLHLQGMGGGSFHHRVEPTFGRYGEDTPQYQAMFSSYLKQLEAHLREKGWLKMAYVYWFDEPEPKDYAFVRKGMERIKQHAPGVPTMLTEEPGDALAGPIDIWCPVSFNYNHAEAEKRRAKGERLWWYVCCGPKAPYCTLFIDHPATELRVWLWQTWQRNIGGILIWSTNYWTSEAAYPEKPQNPYEDPMGYVSGYGTPKGVKNYWGNGDGRFVYPPEAAAVPGLSGPEPVLEPPVSSIRWEMLREGIEDVEYLYLLRELLAKRPSGLSPQQLKAYEELLTVPAAITRDMTTFTTDPAPIYTRRAAIAEAIERLSK